MPMIIPINFEKKRDEIQGRVNAATELKTLNDKLKAHNWMFIHPNLFMTELNRLLKLADNPSAEQAAVTQIFADLFYDFRVTSFFIDGLLKTNTYIAPFSLHIDQAVMLAVTHNYAGAIHLLIPAIEGSLRKYMIDIRGKTDREIMRASDQLKVFGLLEADYIATKEPDFKAQLDAGHIDQSKYLRLVDLERQYIKTWYGMIEDYLRHNLYMDTSKGSISDDLNRHALVHGFESQVDYNLSNFLKIFNAVQYVAWAFQVSDPAIPQIMTLENEDILYKWSALEKLKLLNALTDPVKLAVYSKCPDFDASDFTFSPTQNRFPPLDPGKPIVPQLGKIDQMLADMWPGT